jgi:hypothetical protein
MVDIFCGLGVLRHYDVPKALADRRFVWVGQSARLPGVRLSDAEILDY